MCKSIKTNIIYKAISITLIAVLLLNEAGFAADEIRSCLAVPNFFNPPCKVVYDAVSGEYRLESENPRESLPVVFFLWHLIADALHKDLLDVEKLRSLINELILERFKDDELRKKFDWGNISYSNGTYILPLSDGTKECHFSKNLTGCAFRFEVERGKFIGFSVTEKGRMGDETAFSGKIMLKDGYEEWRISLTGLSKDDGAEIGFDGGKKTVIDAIFYWVKYKKFDHVLDNKNMRVHLPVNNAASLKIDPDKFETLSEIFFYLLDNAWKYAQNRESAVRIEPHADSMHIEIEDRGIGIPRDSIPMIGVHGYRAPNAKEVTSDGSGLGIASVELLIDKLNGEFSFESVEGKGTKVILDLPHILLPEDFEALPKDSRNYGLDILREDVMEEIEEELNKPNYTVKDFGKFIKAQAAEYGVPITERTLTLKEFNREIIRVIRDASKMLRASITKGTVENVFIAIKEIVLNIFFLVAQHIGPFCTAKFKENGNIEEIVYSPDRGRVYFTNFAVWVVYVLMHSMADPFLISLICGFTGYVITFSILWLVSGFAQKMEGHELSHLLQFVLIERARQALMPDVKAEEFIRSIPDAALQKTVHAHPMVMRKPPTIAQSRRIVDGLFGEISKSLGSLKSTTRPEPAERNIRESTGGAQTSGAEVPEERNAPPANPVSTQTNKRPLKLPVKEGVLYLRRLIAEKRREAGKRPVFVGIDGDGGVGKTTFASSLVDSDRVIVIEADKFREAHTLINWDQLQQYIKEQVSGKENVVVIIEGYALFLDIGSNVSPEQQKYIINTEFDIRVNLTADFKTKCANLRKRHPDWEWEYVEDVASMGQGHYITLPYHLILDNSHDKRFGAEEKIEIINNEEGMPVSPMGSGAVENGTDDRLAETQSALKSKMAVVSGFYKSGEKSGKLTAVKKTENGVFCSSPTKELKDTARIFLEGQADKKVLDLGSGTGKAVASFSLYAGYVKGIEINASLHNQARASIDELDKQRIVDKQKIELVQGDFFEEDFSQYDLIYIYWPYSQSESISIANRLKEKLLRELKPNAVFVICCSSPEKLTDFPGPLEKIELPYREEHISESIRAYRLKRGDLSPPSNPAEKNNPVLDAKEAIEGFASGIETRFSQVLDEEGLLDRSSLLCMITSKILAKIISAKFGIPIGGDNAERVEVVPGYYNGEQKTYHQWIALYMDGKPVLFIDPSYWQFTDETEKTIVKGHYEESIQQYKLEESRRLFEIEMGEYLKSKGLEMTLPQGIVYISNNMPNTDFYYGNIPIIYACENYNKDERIRNGELVNFGPEIEQKIEKAITILLAETTYFGQASGGENYQQSLAALGNILMKIPKSISGINGLFGYVLAVSPGILEVYDGDETKFEALTRMCREFDENEFKENRVRNIITSAKQSIFPGEIMEIEPGTYETILKIGETIELPYERISLEALSVEYYHGNRPKSVVLRINAPSNYPIVRPEYKKEDMEKWEKLPIHGEGKSSKTVRRSFYKKRGRNRVQIGDYSFTILPFFDERNAKVLHEKGYICKIRINYSVKAMLKHILDEIGERYPDNWFERISNLPAVVKAYKGDLRLFIREIEHNLVEPHSPPSLAYEALMGYLEHPEITNLSRHAWMVEDLRERLPDIVKRKLRSPDPADRVLTIWDLGCGHLEPILLASVVLEEFDKHMEEWVSKWGKPGDSIRIAVKGVDIDQTIGEKVDNVLKHGFPHDVEDVILKPRKTEHTLELLTEYINFVHSAKNRKRIEELGIIEFVRGSAADNEHILNHVVETADIVYMSYVLWQLNDEAKKRVLVRLQNIKEGALAYLRLHSNSAKFVDAQHIKGRTDVLTPETHLMYDPRTHIIIEGSQMGPLGLSWIWKYIIPKLRHIGVSDKVIASLGGLEELFLSGILVSGIAAILKAFFNIEPFTSLIIGSLVSFSVFALSHMGEPYYLIDGIIKHAPPTPQDRLKLHTFGLNMRLFYIIALQSLPFYHALPIIISIHAVYNTVFAPRFKRPLGMMTKEGRKKWPEIVVKMGKAVHKAISRWRNRKKIYFGKEANMAIPDLHGNFELFSTYVSGAERLGVEKIVFLGDIIDRRAGGIKIYNEIRKLVEQDKAVALLGNHELVFIKAMLGDVYAFEQLMHANHGGIETLREAGIEVGDFYKMSTDEIYRLHPEMRENGKLKELAEWLIKNAKLYYLDEHRTLYVHGGLPVDLSFAGQKGLKALDIMQRNLRSDDEFFMRSALDDLDKPDSVVWVRYWADPGFGRSFEEAKEIYRSWGIERIVHGHTLADLPVNVEDFIFNIEAPQEDGTGYFLISHTKGSDIWLEGQERTERKVDIAPRPPEQAVDIFGSLLRRLFGEMDEDWKSPDDTRKETSGLETIGAKVEQVKEESETGKAPVRTEEAPHLITLPKEELDKRFAVLSADAEDYRGTATPKSVILFADDLLNNAILFDFETTLRKLADTKGLLQGGKIVLYTKDKALSEKVEKLERLIKQAAEGVSVLTVTPEDIYNGPAPANKNEAEKIDDLIRELERTDRDGDKVRDIDRKDVLAIIRGNRLDWPILFRDYNQRIPLIVINDNLKGIFSFAEAMALALQTIRDNPAGAKPSNWIKTLNCIKGTEKLYKEYIRYREEVLTSL